MEPLTLADFFAGVNLIGLLTAVGIGGRYVGRLEAVVAELKGLPSKVERNRSDIDRLKALQERD